MLVHVLRDVLEQPTSLLLACGKDQPPIRGNGGFQSIEELLSLFSVRCTKQVSIVVEVVGADALSLPDRDIAANDGALAVLLSKR